MAYKEICTTLAKVGATEPIFVLRAADKLAPAAIREWIRLADAYGVDGAKLAEAEACAVAMERWSGTRKIPD